MIPTEIRLGELFTAHAGDLHKYMHKLTGDREEAADLVQEAFLRLCQQTYVPDYPRAWLKLTGYRLFIDYLRVKKRYIRVPLDPSLRCSGTPEQAMLELEFDRQLRELLLRLQPRTRDAMCLRIYEQINYGEIAKRLGCSENTIKTCVRRGRRKLIEWL